MYLVYSRYVGLIISIWILLSTVFITFGLFWSTQPFVVYMMQFYMNLREEFSCVKCINCKNQITFYAYA